MKRINTTARKLCFISNSERSYLSEYLHINHYDSIIEYSFSNMDLNELIIYQPDIIVIDQYFTDKDQMMHLEEIKLHFKNTFIYFLSPEYAKYSNVIQSLDHKKHFYSNLSATVLNHINTCVSDDEGNYLKAL